MSKIRKLKFELAMLVFCWCVASVACSAVKSYTPYNGVSNCGKDYPIDYIIYTGLFCEIKK